MENQQQQNNQETTLWTCSCGRVNDNQYCCDCGSPKPTPAPVNTRSQLPNQPAHSKPKEKMSKLKLLLIILAFVATFGFQALVYASVFGTMSLAMWHTLDKDNYGYEYLFEDSPFDDEGTLGGLGTDSANQIAYCNEQFRKYFDFDSSKGNAISTDEINSVASSYYPDQSKTGTDYSPGVYTVGKDIDPGRYLIYGTQKEISTFFVLNKHEETDSYDVVILNTYYGHNQVELAEGQIIICDSEKGFCSKSDYTSPHSNPYKSGVYEVGKDIPAGTYTLKPGEANDYSAYYIMKDLSYTDDSVTDEKAFYFSNEKMEIKLTEGTFVEFYNLTAQSGSATSAAFA